MAKMANKGIIIPPFGFSLYTWESRQSNKFSSFRSTSPGRHVKAFLVVSNEMLLAEADAQLQEAEERAKDWRRLWDGYRLLSR